MAELINMPRAAWKRQPTGIYRVGTSEMAKGIVALWAPFSPSLTVVGTLPPLVANRWVGRRFSNAGGFAFADPGRYALQTLSFAIYMRPDWDATSNYGAPFSKTYNNAESPPYGSFWIEKRGSLSNGDIRFSSGLSAVTYSNREDVIISASKSQGAFVKCYENGQDITAYSVTADIEYDNSDAGKLLIGCRSTSVNSAFSGDIYLFLLWSRVLDSAEHAEFVRNPWQLFAPDPPRFYLIPSGGSSPTCQISVDALIQRAGLTQTTSLDALLQSAFSRSLSIDGLIAAVQAETISLDALLQIVGTRTVSVDALVQAVKSGTVSVDALVQMTLAQSLSLDALIVAASASSASTDFDALIQALKTAGISLDALLSQSKTATAVIDALIQASKAGTVSLDALITGASLTTAFVGLDALIQAIQAKTISLDALLQKSYTNALSLDAYVALTQIKTVSMDALLQNTKTGVISLDAILQMTKTAMVSFDALIQAAKTGVISLDAILAFATQASVLLDAYVQKTLARGVGLDAIIGAIADMILPTGRVITVPASDRFVFVTHSDRVIQIQ